MRKKGALLGTRQAQLVVVYSYARWCFLRMNKTQTKWRKYSFLTSTESNPDVIGAALAGQSLGARQVFVNHGFLDVDLGVFFHDTYVIQGNALKERIEQALRPHLVPEMILVGPYFAPKVLRQPQVPPKKIGIVCPLSSDSCKVLALIDLLVEEFKETIIEVRLHPNRAFSRELEKKLLQGRDVKVTTSGNWNGMGYDWDLALAGNTSAHLDLIALGIPSVGWDMDRYPFDRYGFHENGLVPFRSDLKNLIQSVRDFYSAPTWMEKRLNYLPTQSAKVSLERT